MNPVDHPMGGGEGRASGGHPRSKNGIPAKGFRTRDKKKASNKLSKWSKQKWRTKSGKPSSKTGERYLPAKAIKNLSSKEYAATTKAKRKGTAAGKQFVRQPKKIAKKTRKFRTA